MMRPFFLYYLAIVLISLIMITPANAQVFEGDLRLNTQSQVNAFNYTEVTGSLDIFVSDVETDRIVDLSPLSSLTKVGRDLGISSTDITDLKGLSNLSYIGVAFNLFDNPQLQNIDDLANLNLSPLRFIRIRGNDALTNLEGLANVPEVESITIRSNRQLQSLIGLPKALEVIELAQNRNLQNLNGLEIAAQMSQVIISDHPAIENLRPLGKLEDTFFLRLNALPKIQNLKDLESLRQARKLSIERLNLSNLEGLEEVSGVDNLVIGNMPQLASFAGLSNVKSLNFLDIFRNDVLMTLQGLDSLHSVGRSFVLKENPVLQNLEGIQIQSVGWDLEIRNNPALKNLKGLETLQRVERNLIIEENDSLESLDGLEGLNLVQNEIDIDSPNLKNIQGLKGLKTVGFSIDLKNTQIQNLDGFSNLTSIFGFTIRNNPILTNIEGLSGIETINWLVITGNSSLKDCCILPSLLEIAQRVGVADNDSLCSSLEIVSLQCERDLSISTDLVDAQLDVVVAPLEEGDMIDLANFEGLLDIQASLQGNSKVGSVRFELFDENGERIQAALENFAPYVLGGNVGQDFEGIELAPGSYTLEVLVYAKKNGVDLFESTSLSFSIIDSRVGEITFNIFPNTTQGFIQVRTQLKKKEKAKFQLYNAQGQLIKEQAFTGTLDTSLDLSGLPEGIYLSGLLVQGQLMDLKRILLKK